MTDGYAQSPAARAERVFEQRSLARCAERIADPELRAQASDLAAGRLTPAEFMRVVGNSSTAWRGLQRSVSRYLSLTDAQREELVGQYQQQVDAIATELAAEARPEISAVPRRPASGADDGWDDQQTWLEEAR